MAKSMIDKLKEKYVGEMEGYYLSKRWGEKDGEQKYLHSAIILEEVMQQLFSVTDDEIDALDLEARNNVK